MECSQMMGYGDEKRMQTRVFILLAGVVVLAACNHVQPVADSTGQAVGNAYDATAEATGKAYDATAEYVSDSSITAAVKLRFTQDEWISVMDIKVDTSEGVVSLYGPVKYQGLADRAVALASSVKGVKEVVSHLVVVGLTP